MGLEFISKAVSDGTDTSLQVTGINTDDPYFVTLFNMQTQNNNETLDFRVTKSGSPDTTSNYDRAMKYITTAHSFGNRNEENSDHFQLIENLLNDSGGGQGFLYLYNFNNSSEYSYWTLSVISAVSNQRAAQVGGGIHTVDSASDGVQVFGSSSGTFVSGASLVLYKVIP